MFTPLFCKNITPFYPALSKTFKLLRTGLEAIRTILVQIAHTNIATDRYKPIFFHQKNY
jgi:hypothetical protein